MPYSCDQIKNDNALAVCDFLQTLYSSKLTSVDQGVPAIEFSSGKPVVVMEMPEDATTLPQSIFYQAILAAQDEFVQSIDKATCEVFETPLPTFLKTSGGIEIPWILDDGDPQTDFDKQIVKSICNFVNEQKKRLTAPEDSDEYIAQMATGLFDFIIAEVGLKVNVTNEAPPKEDHPVTALSDGRSELNCLELSSLFTGAALIAGLDTIFIIKYNYLTMNDDSNNDEPYIVSHVKVGIKNKAGKIVTYADPYYGVENVAPNPDISSELPKNEVIAYHFLNKATFTYKSSPEQKFQAIKTAELLAPNSYSVNLALGAWYKNNGDIKTAKAYFEKTAKLNPSFEKIFGPLND